MPTFVSHSFIAFTLGKIWQNGSCFPDTGYPFKFWLFSFVCAILPDIDVLLMSLGVPYIHMFGHRGFSHSILFVFLIALIVLFFGFREVERNSKKWWLLLIYFFFIGLSHILFDALTSGGLGVGFFMPFYSDRYFFAYRPIRASPFSILRFFDSEGLKILASEFIWIWIPWIVLLTIVKLTLHRRKSKQNI